MHLSLCNIISLIYLLFHSLLDIGVVEVVISSLFTMLNKKDLNINRFFDIIKLVTITSLPLVIELFLNKH